MLYCTPDQVQESFHHRNHCVFYLLNLKKKKKIYYYFIYSLFAEKHFLWSVLITVPFMVICTWTGLANTCNLVTVCGRASDWSFNNGVCLVPFEQFKLQNKFKPSSSVTVVFTHVPVRCKTLGLINKTACLSQVQVVWLLRPFSNMMERLGWIWMEGILNLTPGLSTRGPPLSPTVQTSHSVGFTISGI